MSKGPEARVKQKVVEVLKKLGAYYFFPQSGGFGRAGVPDIICCYRGFFVAIECKANGNKPTALQVREIEKIRLAQGIAVVVDETNWDMIPDLLRKVGEQT